MRNNNQTQYIGRGALNASPILGVEFLPREDHKGHVVAVLRANPEGFTGPWGLVRGGADFCPDVWSA